MKSIKLEILLTVKLTDMEFQLFKSCGLFFEIGYSKIKFINRLPTIKLPTVLSITISIEMSFDNTISVKPMTNKIVARILKTPKINTFTS